MESADGDRLIHDIITTQLTRFIEIEKLQISTLFCAFDILN